MNHSDNVNPLLVACPACGCIFHSGFEFAGDADFVIHGLSHECPKCGGTVNIDWLHVQGVIEGALILLQRAKEPRSELDTVIEELRRIRNTTELLALREHDRLARWKAWLPDTPEKIAAYLAILLCIQQAISRSGHVPHQASELVVPLTQPE